MSNSSCSAGSSPLALLFFLRPLFLLKEFLQRDARLFWVSMTTFFLLLKAHSSSSSSIATWRPSSNLHFFVSTSSHWDNFPSNLTTPLTKSPTNAHPSLTLFRIRLNANAMHCCPASWDSCERFRIYRIPSRQTQCTTKQTSLLGLDHESHDYYYFHVLHARSTHTKSIWKWNSKSELVGFLFRQTHSEHDIDDLLTRHVLNFVMSHF